MTNIKLKNLRITSYVNFWNKLNYLKGVNIHSFYCIFNFFFLYPAELSSSSEEYQTTYVIGVQIIMNFWV